MNNETQSRILTRGIFHLLFNAYIISNAEFRQAHEELRKTKIEE